MSTSFYVWPGAVQGTLGDNMAKHALKRPKLVETEGTAGIHHALPGRHALLNQVELAYDRIEELIVNCKLRPGRFLVMQDLQDLVALGRTPVHQAVSRLATDTLMIVHPR